MRGQIRKRGKSWVAIVYLGSDPQTGKRYKWHTCRTRSDAEAYLAQILVQVQGGGGVPPARLRTRDFLDQWLRDDIAKRLVPTTEAIYASAVRRLVPTLGETQLSRLSTPAIQHALNGMSDTLSAATVHQTYRALNTALNTAVAWGLLVSNPCRHVKPPTVDERAATVWDEEQVRLFLAEAKRSSAHYRLYLTIVLTGARPGEVLALKWSSVNLRGRN